MYCYVYNKQFAIMFCLADVQYQANSTKTQVHGIQDDFPRPHLRNKAGIYDTVFLKVLLLLGEMFVIMQYTFLHLYLKKMILMSFFA